jgi:alpha-D-ribose 1-methylphosphonate 5-triphosphate synthase subunit PhnG
MFQSFDSPAVSNQKARVQWMALLARAPMPLLERTLELHVKQRRTEWLRRPETGLYMVQGRVGGTGERFNLGEITVTRCTLRSKALDGTQGAVGVAYVLGRNHRQAELAALADALLQEPTYHQNLAHELLTPVRQHLSALRSQHEAQTQSTKVDFFTVAREAGDTDEEEGA